MIRFKKEIEKILEDRKPDINLTTYQHIKKNIDQGADDMDPYTLSNMCRDLKCLPTDIVEYS
jgi:DNA-binding Xre family transcriptional regulator